LKNFEKKGAARRSGSPTRRALKTRIQTQGREESWKKGAEGGGRGLGIKGGQEISVALDNSVL